LLGPDRRRPTTAIVARKATTATAAPTATNHQGNAEELEPVAVDGDGWTENVRLVLAEPTVIESV
jgi:hypothetical protein